MELEPKGTIAAPGLTLIEEGARWQLHNDTASDLAVERVSRVFELRHRGPLRMFRHGYQSWTWSGLAVVGQDRDPSVAEGSLALVRAMHHPDDSIRPADELRSELVTVLADDAGAVVLGADGGDRHDTTFVVRALGPGHAEIRVDAFFGGAVLPAGSGVALHEILTDLGDDPAAALAWWAGSAGRRHRARVAAPFQLGWCSWYQYFHEVTEADIRLNLAHAADWPFEVFQIDDGFQSAIGDWLTTNPKFPTPLEELAADIAAAGMTPGLWLAPFLAAPDSAVAGEHPDWIAQRKPGQPLIGMINEGWGGATWCLDTTHPEVLDHLETLARALVDRGFQYLKLDFTYAAGIRGVFHDPTRTPAQRVRAGYDAIRRGAGDDVFILGCGAPMGACIGVVDGMRIGADVAPWWSVTADQWRPPGYEGNEPATANAFQNTLSRSFMHRRLWLNDPDCLMLRTEGTALSPAAVEAWALAVGLSGGMALVSDDLSRLGPDARARLDHAVVLGREADQRAIDGGVISSPDVLERRAAAQLRSGDRLLTVDLDTQTATLT